MDMRGERKVALIGVTWGMTDNAIVEHPLVTAKDQHSETPSFDLEQIAEMACL